jgi:hypothetical protein
MNGKANSAEAQLSAGGLATAQFRFEIPQLAVGSFIENLFN